MSLWAFGGEASPLERRLSRLILLLGMGALPVAIALTIRAYMPCPYWDEWAQINSIAEGMNASNWGWLWSQHNEHRILIPRLLLLLDLRAFGGKNVSLFVEIYLVQILEWAAICYAVERFTKFPRALKSTLQGVFAFCIFHLNQAQNLTWAFQVSCVLPFALATGAFLLIAFAERFRRAGLAVAVAGAAPMLAGLNLAGGLLIGPVAIAFAGLRRLPARYVLTLAMFFAASAAAYLVRYQSSYVGHAPVSELSHGKSMFVYVLTYFGASWTRLLPHKERITCFLSFLSLAALIVTAVRDRRQTTSFEWFCIAQCMFSIGTAALTSLARLQFGVGQAYAGRYQTPAMLYWASHCALLLIAVWRRYPARFRMAQACVLAIFALSAATFVPIWRDTTRTADALRTACRIVMSGNRDERAAKLLYGSRQDVAPGVAFLHRLWRK